MKEKAILSYKGWNVSIEAESDGVTGIQFLRKKSNKAKKVQSPVLKEAIAQLKEYFDGKRHLFTIPIHVSGTLFQQKVWEQLRNIPYGSITTYKDLAISLGNPKATRAVGGANNKNPLPIVVPCHRVVGTDGKLVGFAAGMRVKERLLKLEGLAP